MRHKLAYALTSPLLKSVAASTFNGLSGSGASSSANIAVHAELSVHAGVHCSLSTSKQISPSFQATLGWNILVLNLITGGFVGYVDGTCIDSSNVPDA